MIPESAIQPEAEDWLEEPTDEELDRPGGKGLCGMTGEFCCGIGR